MMNEKILDLTQRIRELQNKLEEEIDKSLGDYEVEFRKKIAYFRKEVQARHRKLKQGLFPFIASSNLPNLLVAPVIYSVIVPIVIADIWITLYQKICFPIYGIPQVKRSHYVVIDRHHLAYLNMIEKLNCVYCGYGNGVFAYARAVAGRTEQYWCPIKHARRVVDPHQRYFTFLNYGDAEGYRKGLTEVRSDIQKQEGEEE